MSKHLFGQVITAYGTAANNRGENEGGNIASLQKILWKGEVHTTVSAEAIRWALRYYWQLTNVVVNRIYKWDGKEYLHTWLDQEWAGWLKEPRQTFIDDDVLGFMKATAAAQEGEGEDVDTDEKNENTQKKKQKKAKGKSVIRKGVLEFSKAISLTPFSGDISFNARSGIKDSNSLYATEIHATRYQYGFSMTPESLEEKNRISKVLEAILNLNQVAGNHSRFLYDFSPESVILRWTDDFAPRILYSFEENGNEISINSVIEKVKAGDIEPETLIIAGPVTKNKETAELKSKGVTLFAGVKQGFAEIENRIKNDLNIK